MEAGEFDVVLDASQKRRGEIPVPKLARMLKPGENESLTIMMQPTLGGTYQLLGRGHISIAGTLVVAVVALEAPMAALALGAAAFWLFAHSV